MMWWLNSHVHTRQSSIYTITDVRWHS
jgi:hypothetical protein